MTGLDLKEARKKRGWTQKQAAQQLGVSQAYVSMLERDRRQVPSALLDRVLVAYDLAPLALPLRGANSWATLDNDHLATELGALGYPGFSYVRARPTWNPAELLVATLSK